MFFPHAAALPWQITLPMTTSFPHDFDRRASIYEEHAPVQREAAAWLAEWLPETIGGPVLEVGAGTGLFTRHLAGRTGQLWASDISPRMVQAGRTTVPAAQWSVADATNPPAGPGYRWVFSCSLIQWLPDPASAFQAWHRMTVPGARLVSGWFVRGTLAGLFEACPEAAPFTWRGPAEWHDLLQKNGWETERSESRTYTRQHLHSTAMLRAVQNAGAVIPHRLGAGRLRQALRQYDREHRGENGVTANFEFLRLEALRS